MRIIAGLFRGRLLKAPPSNSTRPTSGRVREAIFNMVSHRIDMDKTEVLDLYAGTGALGLEAVSRGSSAACFVESNPGVLNVCRDNARSLGVENSCRFERMDVIRYLQSESSRTFTLIFADPPYRDPAVPDMVAGAMTRLAPGGLLVVEHVRGLTFPDVSEQVSTRKYGRTAVTIFTRSESDDGTN